jgi:hypothetical protein
MEREKADSKQRAEAASGVREQEQAGAEKRREIKKKLQEVRRSLKDYLVANKDPQAGVIMRCIDESMIYHFMERYQGFSMSVEAILALVGNSLGTSLVNPEIPAEVIGDDDVINSDAEVDNYVPGKGKRSLALQRQRTSEKTSNKPPSSRSGRLSASQVRFLLNVLEIIVQIYLSNEKLYGTFGSDLHGCLRLYQSTMTPDSIPHTIVVVVAAAAEVVVRVGSRS